MKKFILFLVTSITLLFYGCVLNDVKLPCERTGDVIVEGKNTSTHGNAFQTVTDHEIYGSLGDEFVKFMVTQDEYDSISVGDTIHIYHKFVYFPPRQ